MGRGPLPFPFSGATMLIAVLLLTTSIAAVPQSKPAKPDVPPQQLFESGKYQEAIDKIKSREDAPSDQIYLQALAHRKLNQNDDAKEAFGKLAEQGDDSAWHHVGKSGTALVDGDQTAAADEAKKAVEIDGGLSE